MGLMIFRLNAVTENGCMITILESLSRFFVMAASLLVSVILFINVRTHIYKKQMKQDMQYAAMENSDAKAWKPEI